MAAGQGHGSGGQGGKQLLNAVAKGGAERVGELLRQGIGPGTRDRRGRTPVHIAVGRREGSGGIIRAMAAAGLDLDAADREGNSALHLAALDPNRIAFAVLVECGANPMLPNAKGLTPMAILKRAVHPVTLSDAMYRLIFRHKPMARGLLRLVLPSGMVGEDAEVTAIDGDPVSHTLGHQLRSDLVLLREGARSVTVICEFQSGTDTDMAEKMAAHRIETVRTVRRHHPEFLDPGGRVPFTVGVVVHSGSGAWDAAMDAAELMDPPDHPGSGMSGLSSAYSVIGVPETDFPDHPGNPAAAYFRLLRGDPEFVPPAARSLDRLLPLDKYCALRHLLLFGVMLGIDAETYPAVRTALEGEPTMTPFAENFNRAVAAAREAAAETAGEKALISDPLARERELLVIFVALKFGPEIARRTRHALESMDEPDGMPEFAYEPSMMQFVENLNRSVAPAKEAAAEIAREKAKAKEALAEERAWLLFSWHDSSFPSSPGASGPPWRPRTRPTGSTMSEAGRWQASRRKTCSTGSGCPTDVPRSRQRYRGSAAARSEMGCPQLGANRQ